MNRFWNFVFVVVVCGFGGAAGVHAADNLNKAVVTKVQLKSTEARLTFKITIVNPAQPVVLEVDALNTVGAVIGSMTPSPALMYYQVTGTEGETGKQDQILLRLPTAGEYEFSLVDATSISVKPQYVVIASISADATPVLTTRVHSNLVVSLKKNFVHSIDDAIVNFNEGGIDRQIDVKTQPFIKDGFSIHPDTSGIEVKQNLAFLAKDSEFDVNGTAMATLQFPMAGNWPPQWTTLNGTIGFVYPGISNLPMVPESAFAATIAKPIHSFANQLQITRTSTLSLDKDSSYLDWPEIRYAEVRRFSTIKGAVAYVYTGSKVPVSVPGTDINPVSLKLYVHPEQGKSAYMNNLLKILTKLTDDNTPSGSRPLTFPFTPVQENLESEIPKLKDTELNIVRLFNRHNYLVQTGESAEVVANSRNDLESAKRAAELIVESHNNLVKSSYP